MCFERKDRPVFKTRPARLGSRARQRLVETDQISFLKSKQSRLHRKTTKRNDDNEKSKIGVNCKLTFFVKVMGTCFRWNFHVNSFLCHLQTLRESRAAPRYV